MKKALKKFDFQLENCEFSKLLLCSNRLYCLMLSRAVYSVMLRGVDFSRIFGFEYIQEQETEL
jgi:hypothetical protein